MQIEILSKTKHDHMMAHGEVNPEKCPETMFISIIPSNPTDLQKSYWGEKPSTSNVFIVKTDDTEQDDAYPDLAHPGKMIPVKAMRDTQARELVKFITEHQQAKRVIIHCQAGISRSGAVGVFINEVFNGSNKEFYKRHPHIQPNGHILMLLRQEYKKLQKINASVVVFLTDDNKKVLLLKRVTPPYGFGLPGGKIEQPWETFEEGAVREVFEETGLLINPDDLLEKSFLETTKYNIKVFKYTQPFPDVSKIKLNQVEHSEFLIVDVTDTQLNYAGDTFQFICSCLV